MEMRWNEYVFHDLDYTTLRVCQKAQGDNHREASASELRDSSDRVGLEQCIERHANFPEPRAA